MHKRTHYMQLQTKQDALKICIWFQLIFHEDIDGAWQRDDTL